MEYLHVKNWQTYQHYRDRNPPWIKLHYEIMTSSDWVMLADANKLLAVVCMLVASRHEGRVPLDLDYIKRVAYLDKKPDLTPLIKCGFLIVDSNSKQALATARPETETYREETEYSNRGIFPKPENVSTEIWEAFTLHRKAKRAKITKLVMEGIISEAAKAGWTLEAALTESCQRNWQSFKAEWVTKGNQNGKTTGTNGKSKSQRAKEAGDRALARLGIESNSDQEDDGAMLRQLEYIREGTGTA